MCSQDLDLLKYGKNIVWEKEIKGQGYTLLCVHKGYYDMKERWTAVYCKR